MRHSTEELRNYLVYHRQPPIFDQLIYQFQKTKLSTDSVDPNQLKSKYCETFEKWITATQKNKIEGLQYLPHKDFCVGVTEYLDDLYVRYGDKIRYFKNDYSYHWRLNIGQKLKDHRELRSGDKLIISAPFCYYGNTHPEMEQIITYCDMNDVDVHIDSAWFGCVKEMMFDYNRKCIKSAGFSLSKGLGFGHNRIGIRFSKERCPGPITIVNDFNMMVVQLMDMGIRLMENFSSDFVQDRYEAVYNEVCELMSLKPTKAIHVAFGPHPESGDMVPVGVAPILQRIINAKH